MLYCMYNFINKYLLINLFIWISRKNILNINLNILNSKQLGGAEFSEDMIEKIKNDGDIKKLLKKR